MKKGNKTISIITVVFNGARFIESTILSIVNQTFKDYEYIIIDGASKDSTMEIINRYKANISICISEPDKGLYDAMNKGLALANGEYLWFINAGDEIYEPDTLEKIFECKNEDVYYGNAMIINEEGREIGLRRLQALAALSWKDFQYGQLVSHQSFITRRIIAPVFNPIYKYSADIDWQINILKKASTIRNSQLIFCRFLDGGKSKKTIIPSLKERFKIMRENYGLIITLRNHFYFLFRFLLFYSKNKRY